NPGSGLSADESTAGGFRRGPSPVPITISLANDNASSATSGMIGSSRRITPLKIATHRSAVIKSGAPERPYRFDPLPCIDAEGSLESYFRISCPESFYHKSYHRISQTSGKRRTEVFEAKERANTWLSS